MSAITLQSTLERLATLVRSDMRQALSAYGLQPVQFEALYYLSKCNRYSDTAMAVTEYLGQTKGTVSQSLKVLEREGLIKKSADKDDKRVSHLTVTGKGHRVIAKVIPSLVLSRGYEQLSKQQRAAAEDQLQILLRAVQAGNHFSSFGQCATCIHNRKQGDQILCGLTQEVLAPSDTDLICREHAWPT